MWNRLKALVVGVTLISLVGLSGCGSLEKVVSGELSGDVSQEDMSQTSKTQNGFDSESESSSLEIDKGVGSYSPNWGKLRDEKTQMFPEEHIWVLTLKQDGMKDIDELLKDTENLDQIEFLREYFKDSEIERIYFMADGEVLPTSVDQLVQGLKNIVKDYEAGGTLEDYQIATIYSTNMIKWFISYTYAKAMYEVIVAIDKEYPKWDLFGESPQLGDKFNERVEYYSELYMTPLMEPFLLQGLDEYIQQ